MKLAKTQSLHYFAIQKKKKNNKNVRWHWVKCQLTFEPPLHLPNDRHKGNPSDSEFQN